MLLELILVIFLTAMFVGMGLVVLKGVLILIVGIIIFGFLMNFLISIFGVAISIAIICVLGIIGIGQILK